MPKLKTLCAVLLALLWAPLTSHCLLESLGAVPEFLHCADACAPSDADHAEDEDACATVESASYKTEEQSALVCQPALTALCLLAVVLDWTAAAPAGVIHSASPGPAVPCPWQFSQRAAAPPRAPSFPV